MTVATAPSAVRKYGSLVTLTIVNAVFVLSMRFARSRPGDMFVASTAVALTEIFKLALSVGLVLVEAENLKAGFVSLYQQVLLQPVDTIKVALPSLLYVFQNNLLYLAATHLDAATYQVTYQLKILTTALFALLLLKQSFRVMQWLALVVLLGGVVLVQLADSSDSNPDSAESADEQKQQQQGRLIGLAAVLAASVCSGLAGVYFEKILKRSKSDETSLWMRNVQLSLLSVPLGLATCLIYDWTSVRTNGFLFGYDWFVWYLVALQAAGGLVVAMVVKYADNVLKGFATSLAIIVSCLASIYLFAFQLTWQFIVGGSLVIVSVFIYSWQPCAEQPEEKVVELTAVNQKDGHAIGGKTNELSQGPTGLSTVC